MTNHFKTLLNRIMSKNIINLLNPDGTHEMEDMARKSISGDQNQEP